MAEGHATKQERMQAILPAVTGEPAVQLLADRYRLLRKLGKGGMGEVFLAQHVAIEKQVAVKILLEERCKQPNQKQRFLNEARATARIRHPNVIDITDFGETPNGSVFFVMEYLEGEDLKRYLRRRHIVPWHEAAPILLQLCGALGAAHKQGIIHRDLKPDNIFLVNQEGRTDFVKVLDFGLAKLVDDTASKRLTKTGIIVGTPAFLSPEQVRGTEVDHRADIYALGLIMYRMLCGRLPFRARSVVEMLRKQLTETPLPPSAMSVDAEIPAQGEQLVLKALAKNPDDRPQSTEELAAGLASVVAEPVDPDEPEEDDSDLQVTTELRKAVIRPGIEIASRAGSERTDLTGPSLPRGVKSVDEDGVGEGGSWLQEPEELPLAEVSTEPTPSGVRKEPPAKPRLQVIPSKELVADFAAVERTAAASGAYRQPEDSSGSLSAKLSEIGYSTSRIASPAAGSRDGSEPQPRVASPSADHTGPFQSQLLERPDDMDRRPPRRFDRGLPVGLLIAVALAIVVIVVLLVV